MSQAAQPTEEELATFAEQALEVLRGVGAPDTVTYEADDKVIQVNDDVALDINQLYQHYLSQPEEVRQRVLENLGGYYQDLMDGDLPSDWATAAEHVVPVLKARFAYEHLVLDHRINDRNPPHLPRIDMGDEASLGVGYMRRQSLGVIEERHVEAWGVSDDELFARAKANLLARNATPFEQRGPGLYSATLGDGLDASRIALTEQILELELEGHPVAFAPHERLLVIAGSDDPKALGQLAGAGAQSLNDPRNLNIRPLVYEDGEWDDFDVDDNHPVAQPLRLLARAGVARAYHQQGVLLDQILKKEGEAVVCGAYQMLQDRTPEGQPGEIYGLATWAEGVELLLPRADRVIFAKPLGGEKYNVLGQAPWFDVVRVLGERMERTDHHPKRFRVRVFPTADELRALELTRWTPPQPDQQQQEQPPPEMGGTYTA